MWLKSKTGYPLMTRHERNLSKDYKGIIYLWDIDGTYLNTKLESKRDLIKVPFESAKDKKNIPGSDVLLMGLRIGSDENINAMNPIYFVTASPPMLESAITKKMRMDGVEYDGITYKDYTGIVLRLRFKEFKNQYAYKLNALLDNRMRFPANSSEILFGDNYEQDSGIYRIYAEIIEPDIDYFNVKKRMRRLDMSDKYINLILEKSRSLEKDRDKTVEEIYIHLTSDKTESDDYKEHSHILIPVNNFFEASARLYQKGYISMSSVKNVFNNILSYEKIDRTGLINGLESFTKKDYITEQTFLNVKQEVDS